MKLNHNKIYQNKITPFALWHYCMSFGQKEVDWEKVSSQKRPNQLKPHVRPH